MCAVWIDLEDPTRLQLEKAAPADLHPRALELLERESRHGDDPRPTLEGHGDYVFGLFLVPQVQPDREVIYREIDIILTSDTLMTVRKRGADGGDPFHCTSLENMHEKRLEVAKPGLIAYQLLDDVAEGFLDLTDGLNEEIDELEDHVDDLPNEVVRKRLSDLRHDFLHIRKVLSPTRDAIHRVVDNRVDTDDEHEELFPHEIELHFADVYDKLLRASEALELSRDLVAGVRDYHQSKISNDQNEVMKRLTVVASILLPPTFIVGLYGQNLKGVPEFHWRYGYAWSWALIIVLTIGQLVYMRRKRWI
ncbi:MAG TPA: magnesium transporter CorA family protein [Gaiellales bacterium]|jgi:magnesium transporter